MKFTRKRIFFPVFLVIVFIMAMWSGLVSPPVPVAATVRIDNITWQGEAVSGAENLGLTIQILNLNDVPIRGILGELTVPFPFRAASDGSNTLSATGVSLSSGASPYTIQPGDPFQLTYSLDIDVDGLKGTYQCALNLSYYEERPGNYLDYEDKDLTINLVIDNSVPTFDFVSPTTTTFDLAKGESTTFEVLGYDSDYDPLTYTWDVNGIVQTTNSSMVRLEKNNKAVTFTAPSTVPATYHVRVKLSDGTDNVVQSWTLNVIDQIPIFEWVTPDVATVNLEPGQSTVFEVRGYDADNDLLTYSWELDDIPVTTNSSLVSLQNNNQSLNFTAGLDYPVTYYLTVEISDGYTNTMRSWNIEVSQDTPETEFNINSQYIEAGVENNITLTMANDVWVGTVDCSFAITADQSTSIQGTPSQTLVVKGNLSRTLENVKPGDGFSLPITIYAPSSLIGKSVSVALTVTYKDEHSIQYTEIYNPSLIIQGLIVLEIIDASISTTQLSRGSEVTVSGVLLNVGNSNAQFLNVSLVDDYSNLVFKTASKTYLGELEPDNPTPFSLAANIRDSASLGSTTIICVITYQDDLFNEHEIRLTFAVEILEWSSTSSSTGATENPGNRPNIMDLLPSLVLIVGAIVGVGVIIIFYRRYQRKTT
ncbi:MAG: hypothetical protein ACFFBD_02885 [Candidatus Hodarchaeota archaeon]